MNDNIVTIRRFVDSENNVKGRFFEQYGNLYFINTMDLKELLLTKENKPLFDKKIKDFSSVKRLKEIAPEMRDISSYNFLT
jgi:hypothetical protein